MHAGGFLGMIVAAAVGGGLAVAATFGTVATMSATPDPQTTDQPAVVQYADE